MNKQNYKSPMAARLLYYFVFAVIFLFVLLFVIRGLSQASSASDSEGMRIAEKSIQRSVINCYASEGNYPPNFEYLKDHYGINVDENKYIVHYEIFASNIMPEITVLKIER